MLDPNWDPETQWDGSPAQTQGSRLVIAFSPEEHIGRGRPKRAGIYPET